MGRGAGRTSDPAARATAGPAANPVQRFFGWFEPATPAKYLAALVVVAIAGYASYWAGRGLSSAHDQFDLKIYDAAIRYWTGGGELYEYSQYDRLMDSLGFTYPPFAAVLMTPMSLLPWQAVQSITVIAIAAACALFCYLVIKDSVRLRGAQGLLIVGLVTSAAFVYEPIRENVSYGQVNIFLGLLVVGDFLFLARRYPKLFGIGIGIAAAIKLTPAIFVVYLLITRRWRPAIVATITAVVLSFGTALVARKEVWDFFTKILWDTSRVGHPDNVFNQSLNGLIARLASPELPSRGLWALSVLVVLGFGMWRARSLYLAGDDLAGVVVTGLVAQMISPVSWTHHAVWCIPATVVLLHRCVELGRDWAVRTAEQGRQFWGLLALAVAGAGWTIEAHHYVTDRTKDWSVATWSDQLLATLPTIWCLLVIAFLPARQLLPLWSASVTPVPQARGSR